MLSSTFQPPEEDLGVQMPKRCDKQGGEDEVSNPKNVNNLENKIYSNKWFCVNKKKCTYAKVKSFNCMQNMISGLF